MSRIFKHIEKGDIDKAIELALLHSSEEEKSSIILLKSRLSRLNSDKQNGVLSRDQYNAELNQLTNTLLNTQNKGKVNSWFFLKNSEKKLIAYVFGIVVLILLVLSIMFMQKTNIGIQGDDNDNNRIEISDK